MLDKIKTHYSFKKDSQFARFLGIRPQVLSNWKSRNTFDPALIYTKCVGLNPSWILTGNGDMLLPQEIKDLHPIEEESAEYKLREKVTVLKEQIQILKETNRTLKEHNQSLKELKMLLEQRIKELEERH